MRRSPRYAFARVLAAAGIDTAGLDDDDLTEAFLAVLPEDDYRRAMAAAEARADAGAGLEDAIAKAKQRMAAVIAQRSK